jgi:hypothetical protein
MAGWLLDGHWGRGANGMAERGESNLGFFRLGGDVRGDGMNGENVRERKKNKIEKVVGTDGKVMYVMVVVTLWFLHGYVCGCQV